MPSKIPPTQVLSPARGGACAAPLPDDVRVSSLEATMHFAPRDDRSEALYANGHGYDRFPAARIGYPGIRVERVYCGSPFHRLG